MATYAGRIAGENLVFGTEHVPYYGDISSAVYAVPALASVGLTEAEARDKGLKFSVKINDMASWRSAKTYAEAAAWSKVLIDDESNQILGAHIFGHGAEEIIHLFSFAMKHNVLADGLKQSLYSYPTFSSDIKYMV